jgi:hypothetical protein
MSENETIQKDSENVFSACQENVDTLINGIRRSVPHYHQSITNVQQEYLHAYENLFDTSIALQKEFAKKSGISANIPQATLKIIRDTTEEFVKVSSIQNQITLAIIDATQQNIKGFNDNTEFFAELNKNIFQSWISMFTTKNSK